MDKNKLIGLIRSKGDTCGDAARIIGVTRTTFSKKVNEKCGAYFSQPEILALKTHYCLTADDVDAIFFTQKVS